MKLEIKSKWLAALRSGKYEQGRKRLWDLDDRYCCLGVLVDLVEPEGWVTSSDELADAYYHSGSCVHPPLDLLDRVGLPSEESHKLASMNDGTDKTPGKSFAEIADYIEANL